MLAVVLAGIGLRRAGRRVVAARRAQTPTAIRRSSRSRPACVLALSYAGFRVADTAAAAGEPVSRAIVCHAAPLRFRRRLLSGLFFTLARRRAASAASARRSTAAGWLTLANTDGAPVGPLVAGFVPAAATRDGAVVLRCWPRCTAASAVLLAAGAGGARSAARVPSAAAAIAARQPGARFRSARWRRAYFVAVRRWRHAADGSRVVATREGPSRDHLPDAAGVARASRSITAWSPTASRCPAPPCRACATCAISPTGRCSCTSGRSGGRW